MLKLNSLVGFASKAIAVIPGDPGDVDISLEDSGPISGLSRSVDLGAAEVGRLIVIAYMNSNVASGSTPSDTTLTLGGNTMTRVSTIISGLSGDPQTDGYKCTFYYLQVNTGTSATLARSGGTTGGQFALFRMTGHSADAPSDTAGFGTTDTPVTSRTVSIDIPTDGGLIVCAFCWRNGVGGFQATSLTYNGASRVLHDVGSTYIHSAATRTVEAAQTNHDVTVTRGGGSSGGLFIIAGAWG